jgi:hypothetical protein
MAYVLFALGLQSGCLRFFFVVVLPGGVVAAFGVVYKPGPGQIQPSNSRRSAAYPILTLPQIPSSGGGLSQRDRDLTGLQVIFNS